MQNIDGNEISIRNIIMQKMENLLSRFSQHWVATGMTEIEHFEDTLVPKPIELFFGENTSFDEYTLSLVDDYERASGKQLTTIPELNKILERVCAIRELGTFAVVFDNEYDAKNYVKEVLERTMRERESRGM